MLLRRHISRFFDFILLFLYRSGGKEGEGRGRGGKVGSRKGVGPVYREKGRSTWINGGETPLVTGCGALDFPFYSCRCFGFSR